MKTLTLARCALMMAMGLSLIGCKSKGSCREFSECPNCQAGTAGTVWNEVPQEFYSADGQPLGTPPHPTPVGPPDGVIIDGTHLHQTR